MVTGHFWYYSYVNTSKIKWKFHLAVRLPLGCIVGVCITDRHTMADDNGASNAHWLYQRCSKARATMQTPLTTLQLSLRILHVVKMKSSANNSNGGDSSDDDSIDEHAIQQQLFEATKEGKKRDISFVYEVVERVEELMEDEDLTVEKLYVKRMMQWNKMVRMLVLQHHQMALMQWTKDLKRMPIHHKTTNCNLLQTTSTTLPQSKTN